MDNRTLPLPCGYGQHMCRLAMQLTLQLSARAIRYTAPGFNRPVPASHRGPRKRPCQTPRSPCPTHCTPFVCKPCTFVPSCLLLARPSAIPFGPLSQPVWHLESPHLSQQIKLHKIFTYPNAREQSQYAFVIMIYLFRHLLLARAN